MEVLYADGTKIGDEFSTRIIAAIETNQCMVSHYVKHLDEGMQVTDYDYYWCNTHACICDADGCQLGCHALTNPYLLENRAMNLDTFLTAYAADDNAWWSLTPGEMQAMFDALLERYATHRAEAEDEIKWLRTRQRSYGFGIVDSDGNPYWSDDCVCEDAGPLKETCDSLNESDDPRAPYRVVELSYCALTNP